MLRGVVICIQAQGLSLSWSGAPWVGPNFTPFAVIKLPFQDVDVGFSGWLCTIAPDRRTETWMLHWRNLHGIK